MNYQNHIESAIENVLSKVKHPERHSRSALKKVSADPPVLPKKKPHKQKLKKTGPLDASLKLDGEVFPENEALSKPKTEGTLNEDGLPAEEHVFTESSGTSDELLEGEDLFVPMPLEEEDEDEIVEEEDHYIPPFNLFEEFVETELDILLSRYVDLCQCSQCHADIVAMALQQLPAFYVTGTRSMFTAKNMIYTKYTQKIIDAVTKSIHMIYKRPRSSCRKIKQVLWVKPDLEQVEEMTPESHQLFEDIYDHKVEVSFSDEVADIIETLEASAHEEEAQMMLPVTSGKVKRAYQDPSQEDVDVPDLIADVPEEPLEQATMQLIDDWDTDNDD